MPIRPSSRKAAGVLLAVAVVIIAAVSGSWHGRREQPQQVLDPARIVLLRTPGGFLEVGSLEKAEEFGWSSSWDCGPVADCGKLFGTTVSRLRVRARYTYRIPLAEEWRLVRDGAQWLLEVPQVQLATPVPFHTADVEISTSAGWLSPPVGPNRELLLRNIGPELARRGNEPAYLQAQRPLAQKTVAEFARRWMLEQRKGADLPVQVTFSGPSPG
ncbi:hypothetical protein ACPWT1_18310 [Ramlibacter sp. MMS24-I3-19]|uniref:hypothetical protein n=1 Tax=Ramlibacter sp. MMS24-I3-19 TaxID=3416606 RepID=UPI003CFC04B3